jgi:hypothetical protein
LYLFYLTTAMSSSDHMLLVYRDLADWHERQGLDELRDRFLVLAASAAQGVGDAEEAEGLWQRLLRGNPHHVLRKFASFADAMRASEVQSYVEDLGQEYPLHAAEDLHASVREASAPISKPALTRSEMLPPTAPLIHLRRPREPLKVFRDEETSAPPKPRKSTLPTARPSRILPASAAARPATVVVKPYAPPQSQPAPSAGSLAPEPGPDEEPRGWVALVLFILVLAAAMFLGVVTLIQPFVL